MTAADWRIKMQEYCIVNDGIRYHAKLEKPENTEKCPLLIIFHGFTGHMEERHILAVRDTALSAGYAALRVEMYGHGQSDGEFRDHTLYKWVTGALAVIDYALKLDFVTDLLIAGHSQGGLLTMLVGGMRQERIKAIIPLSPAWMIPEQAREGEVLGVSFDPLCIPEEIQGESWTLKGDYIRTARTIHPEEEIDRFNGPVLIVQGDADDAVPLEYAYKAAERYKNATLLIIPGDTHCYDRHLEQMTEAVRNFLIQIKESS